MIKCPVCGKYEFAKRDDYDICPFCNWENEQFQMDHPDEDGGANKMSLNQAKEAYKKGETVL